MLETVLIVGRVYEHVKTGKRYRVVALAKDERSLEDVVVYEALYDNTVSKVWVRQKTSFLGKAKSANGTLHPRFVLVSAA